MSGATCAASIVIRSRRANKMRTTSGALAAQACSKNMDYRHLQERKSMHGRIVQELGMDIVGGKIKPGERLPVEAALCES